MPEVLFLQLVRWTGSTAADVAHARVIPNMVLNVQGARYHLRSVIVHCGSSADGHYLTYARHDGVAED